tara:strand:+ start:14143 stop:14532 length:390 start_codon:yes stop_codon:yes gene_type:complete
MAGRPAHKPTKAQLGQVEAMAGYGIPQADIARVVGIDLKTLHKHYRHELDVGSAKATAEVAKTLYEQAIGGNIAALIFWMKARAGWSEKFRLEHTGEDGGPIKHTVDPKGLSTQTLKELTAARKSSAGA